MNLDGDRFLVTGGAGFIGSHICEEILAQGKQVVCIDNYETGTKDNIQAFLENPNFTLVEADICDLPAIAPHFEGIDVVFHNAAAKCTYCRERPIRDLQVNAFGAWNVFEASRKAKVKKVVHASTGSVYGELNGKQDENHSLKPVSFYGVSKLTGDRYLEAFYKYYGLRYSIIRYFHVFGSRQESSDYGGVIPIFIRKALKNQPLTIHGDGSQVRCFTYVKDDVDANFILANSTTTDGQAFNCASGVRMTIRQLAETIINITNSKSKIRYEPWRLGDIKNFDVDSTKIINAGMFFTDFAVAFRETINWYKEEFREF